MESMPDILQLLSPGTGRGKPHSEMLPDLLTRREHRIIGIDSHYRITPTQKNGNTAHEKLTRFLLPCRADAQEYSIARIQMAEQQVQENPAKALCRHSLFQLLCVAGDWS